MLLALVLGAGLAVGGVHWWRAAHRSALVQAMALAPADTQRYLWTDWTAVRAAVAESDLTELLEAAYVADLSSASALVDSADALEDSLGFSPASVAWELSAEAERGSVTVVDLGSKDESGVERALERSGYVRDGGIWDGTAVQAGLGVSPQFSYVAVHEGRVYAGDDRGYLADRLAGGGDPDDHVAAAASALGDPLSAVLFGGDYACSALAMSGADDADRAAGEELIAQAGGVSPLTAFAMGVDSSAPGRSVVLVALGFEDHDQAVRDADARAALASGPAPGQGGSFRDRFELGEVKASDDLVTMRLRPAEGAYVVSDLSSGPVLFASC